VAERLRALLEDPLDARVARAALALAAGALLGFAAVTALGLAGTHGGRAPDPVRSDRVVAGRPSASIGPVPSASAGRAPAPAAGHRQDPQDRPGTAAHRRAERELAGHRTLQHLPYRRAGLAVELVGARGRRAVLAVSAPTLREARRGYRRLLRRWGDDGRAYLPRFRAARGHRG
jgi:hypothetical protein